MQISRFTVPLALVPLALGGVALGAPAFGTPSHWQVVPSPGGDVAALRSTSFNSPGDGWAVGSTGTSLVGTGVDTLIEHWDGSKWQVVPSPAVPQSDEALTGVSSTGPDNAWAVGWQDPYGTQRAHGLLLHWDGHAWSVVQGASGAGIPSAIHARTPDDVWAVGVGLFEHFDGTSWSAFRTPRTDAAPVAVTVLSAGDAWAVGTVPGQRSGYIHALPYIAHWDGAAWSTTAFPPASDAGRLASLSAASPSDVWAVGSLGSDPSTPYALHFDGTNWQQVAVPSSGEGSALSGVTVLSSNDVWAVGSQDGRLRSGFAVERSLTQHWDGSAWTVVASKSDSKSDNFLAATASSGGQLWALGGDGGTLIERR